MIKPDKKLAQLHDLYGKHQPAEVVCAAQWGTKRHKQWACSCGHVFWDTNGCDDDAPGELVRNPTHEWVRACRKAYKRTRLFKEFVAYWALQRK